MRNTDPFERCAQALAGDLLNISAFLAHPSGTRRQDLCRARTDLEGVLRSLHAALGRPEQRVPEQRSVESVGRFDEVAGVTAAPRPGRRAE
jgi:hypothetical protein